MQQNGTPLNSMTLASLPKIQQDALRAFFIEADSTLRNKKSLKKETGSIKFVPPQSLQEKYDAVLRFGGDKYCPVRQRAEKFAFLVPSETLGCTVN